MRVTPPSSPPASAASLCWKQGHHVGSHHVGSHHVLSSTQAECRGSPAPEEGWRHSGSPTRQPRPSSRDLGRAARALRPRHRRSGGPKGSFIEMHARAALRPTASGGAMGGAASWGMAAACLAWTCSALGVLCGCRERSASRGSHRTLIALSRHPIVTERHRVPCCRREPGWEDETNDAVPCVPKNRQTDRQPPGPHQLGDVTIS